jgi:hypothetical protein
MKLKSQYLKKSEIDVVSDDGMLIRGVIYLKKLSPLKHKQYSDFTLKIKQNLLNNNDTKLLNELNEIYLSLREKYDVFFDYDLARILISFKVLNENIIFFKLNYENCVFARIEEYPSEDKTCVDLEFL